MRCLNHMPKLSERGVAHLLLLLLLVAGLIVGVYLIQKGPLNFLPKAGGSRPVGPETSFTLAGPGGCTVWWLCLLSGGQHTPQEEFAVKLYARSDIETANLFTAKIIFPKDIVAVKEIQTNDSFVKNWVENFYDNNTGEISLVGGVPAPGYQTRIDGPSGLMAIIIFRAKALGKGTVSFTDSSAILSNLNNINILTIKRGYDITVEVKPAPTPSPISGPISGFSCDVNRDGVKDTKDGELIKSCWNKPATGNCAAVDVDRDGIITTTDIQKFSYNCPEIFGPILTPMPKPFKGDGNKDGKINLIDMSVIHTDWMKTKDSSTAFRDGIDMNSDGVINTFDFALHRQLLLSLGVIKGNGPPLGR